MKSAFDAEDGEFLVVSTRRAPAPSTAPAAPAAPVATGNERLALWPGFVPVPEGWRPVHGPDTRQACLAYAERAAVQTAVRNGEDGQ